jgi:long-chain acyl-CoA synthetase
MRLFDIPFIHAEKFPEKVAFRQKRKGEWEEITYGSYALKVNETAAYLYGLGIRRGDKVGNLLSGSIEWNIIDMAVQKIGAIHVAIFANYNISDYKKILNEAEVKLLIVGTPISYKQLDLNKGEFTHLNKLVMVDSFFEEVAGHCSKEAAKKSIEIVDSESVLISPNDLAFICYTSGTFDKPNGVMMGHRQMVEESAFLSTIYKNTDRDRVLSYLPIAHAYERANNYHYQYCGVTVTYAESPVSFVATLPELLPTFFSTVPIILINLYNNCLQDVSTTDRTLKLSILRERFDKATGGQIRVILSAGAPLPPHIAQDFLDAGVNVWECYGTTEAQIICINNDTYGIKAGTVGTPASGVSIKIAEDGEILIKTPFMTLGYYKNEALTKAVFDEEGWYHSGDSGQWVDGKYLQITGRKRDIFKVANGRYLFPESIEKVLLKSPQIAQVMVFGIQGEAHALIVPAEKDSSNNDSIASAIATLYNDNAPAAEKIMHVTYCATPWTIDAGELTPTMKLKRELIKKKYLAG